MFLNAQNVHINVVIERWRTLLCFVKFFNMNLCGELWLLLQRLVSVLCVDTCDDLCLQLFFVTCKFTFQVLELSFQVANTGLQVFVFATYDETGSYVMLYYLTQREIMLTHIYYTGFPFWYFINTRGKMAPFIYCNRKSWILWRSKKSLWYGFRRLIPRTVTCSRLGTPKLTLPKMQGPHEYNLRSSRYERHDIYENGAKIIPISCSQI